jgi:hypothetical protein
MLVQGGPIEPARRVVLAIGIVVTDPECGELRRQLVASELRAR